MKINIVIPANGKGIRFKDEGYLTPKPLIKCLGKPIIFYLLDNIKQIQGIDYTIHIVHRKEFENYQFEQTIRKSYPEFQDKLKLIPLDYDTKDASATVYEALKNFGTKDLGNPLLILDSDVFYEKDNNLFNSLQSLESSTIFYFNDTQPNPIYSYIKFDEAKGWINDIREKEKISDNACVGAYHFRSGKIFLDTLSEIRQGKNINIDSNKEVYISHIYQHLLSQDKLIYGKKVKGHICVGTPQQLYSFATLNNKFEKPKRFCFDLDNTLVTYPTVDGDYRSVLPIEKNIDFLQKLKKNGHTIIIQTARRMKTHHGNHGALLKDIGKITFDTLDDFGIPYDEIYFGKPHADFYIDDLGVNSFENLEKLTGFYETHTEPRSFNDIEFKDGKVIKKGPHIFFESYYYKNIPDSIKNLFPKYYPSYSTKNKLVIEHLQGTPLSYLNINGLLKPQQIELLFTQIEKIHSANVNKEYSDYFSNINIYSNYLTKFLQRARDIPEEIKKTNLFQNIIYSLKTYEEYFLGEKTVIHGDPVLSNIIYNEKNETLKFIDMRGNLNGTPSLYGDIFYDYAKIYQSLAGYDYIIYNKKINKTEALKNLRIFEDIFKRKFSNVQLENVKMIAKSLIYSLLPLHNSTKHKEFLKLIDFIEQQQIISKSAY